MEEEIGEITHYYTDLEVGVIKLAGRLEVGDEIHVVGATSDFKQPVDSMQVDGQDIESAEAGESVGLKVDRRVRSGDLVYKVE